MAADSFGAEAKLPRYRRHVTTSSKTPGNSSFRWAKVEQALNGFSGGDSGPVDRGNNQKERCAREYISGFAAQGDQMHDGGWCIT